VPQAPQWAESLVSDTHAPEHIVCPAGQVHTPCTQLCPLAHRVPQ
jgi:hypothetical protein